MSERREKSAASVAEGEAAFTSSNTEANDGRSVGVDTQPVWRENRLTDREDCGAAIISVAAQFGRQIESIHKYGPSARDRTPSNERRPERRQRRRQRGPLPVEGGALGEELRRDVALVVRLARRQQLEQELPRGGTT